ncbi:uncharacterized protein A4U43_C03F26320 [Asparagus officinalis]|uniref:Uncharacterized protein n=1 Tax=Asparagus officinalis TaxID=4686 RepID=A0A5P1FD32_ASPOF|nr:uncharacterized protein A4U43_C03F26320 [Asparagus officinalis]
MTSFWSRTVRLGSGGTGRIGRWILVQALVATSKARTRRGRRSGSRRGAGAEGGHGEWGWRSRGEEGAEEGPGRQHAGLGVGEEQLGGEVLDGEGGDHVVAGEEDGQGGGVTDRPGDGSRRGRGEGGRETARPGGG